MAAFSLPPRIVGTRPVVDGDVILPTSATSSTTDSLDLLKQVSVVLLDCDGVLWHSGHAVDGSVEAVSRLRDEHGKRVLFVSNNSTNSRSDYVKKFEKLGFRGVQHDDIISTAAAAAFWLTECPEVPAGAKVLVCGEQGLVDEIQEAGFIVVPPPPASLAGPDLENLQVDREIAAVVCGMDKSMSYAKLCYAYLCLKEIPGCKFLVTNRDSTFPVGAGRLLPGGGSTTMCCLVESTGRQPDACVGKPERFMLEKMVLHVHGKDLNPKSVLMVGDRLNTDMAFGKGSDLQTLLVLTGVSKLADIEGCSQLERPDYWAPMLRDLV